MECGRAVDDVSHGEVFSRFVNLLSSETYMLIQEVALTQLANFSIMVITRYW